MKTKNILLILGILLVLNSFSTKAAITDGLVAYWSFDIGDYANDTVGTNNAVQNTANYVNSGGIIGGYYNFDGSGNICFPDSIVYNFSNNNNFTLSLWLNTSVAGQTKAVFTKQLTSGIGWGLLDLTPNLAWYLNGPGGDVQSYVVDSRTRNYKLQHIVLVYNGSTTQHQSNAIIYINTTETEDSTYGTTVGTFKNSAKLCIAVRDTTNLGDWQGNMDEVGVWNRSLSQSEINDLYSNYLLGYNPTDPFTPSSNQGNVNISNSIFPIHNSQYSNNEINFNTTVNSSVGFNCSLYINSTFDQTKQFSAGNSISVNFSKNMSQGSFNYYFFCFNYTNSSQNKTSATNIFYIDSFSPTLLYNNIDGNFISNTFNLTINATDPSLKYINITSNCTALNYTSSSLTPNLSLNQYYDLKGCSVSNYVAYVTLCDAPNGTLLNCLNNTYNYYTRATLNISAVSATTNTTISNFSVYINGTLLGNTTTGVYQAINLTLADYNITIDADTYATTSYTYLVTNSTNLLNITLYGTNSINIYIIDEVSLTPIYTNISVRFSSTSTVWVNITDDSFLYLENLTAGVYTVVFYSSLYATRTYTLTVGNKTTQSLTAYMISNTYSTIFSITDTDSMEALINVSFSVYQQNGSSWIPVQSVYTDILGKVQFYYNPIGSYRFNCIKSGYNDLIFYLNPVLFSTYDIKMTKNQSINYSVDYDRISILYSPTIFYNGIVNNFRFVISSPDGLFTEYGINLTYPGGSNATSGVNAIGGQLDLSFTPSSTSVFDTVILDYYYITTLSGRRDFRVPLEIVFNTSTTNTTFMTNKDKHYGLGIFERILIITFIVLIVVGLATLIGQPIPGFVLGLFVLGYSAFIGFINLWIILPSMFVGIIFLIWKSGGY